MNLICTHIQYNDILDILGIQKWENSAYSCTPNSYFQEKNAYSQCSQ